MPCFPNSCDAPVLWIYIYRCVLSNESLAWLAFFIVAYFYFISI